MSWDEASVLECRLGFVRLVSDSDITVTEACRQSGISRRTGYKWLNRYQQNGVEGLQDVSRKPRTSPDLTGSNIETAIIELREKHPTWGAKKLKRRLEDLKVEGVPAASTVNRVLKSDRLIDPAESVKHKPFKRFEFPNPNDCWQMDFKGDFVMGNEQRCYPLTVLDDYSRFNLVLNAYNNQQRNTVKQGLSELSGRTGCQG